jgi:hypothetical protein
MTTTSPASERTASVPTRLGAPHVRIIGSGKTTVLWPSMFVDSHTWDRMLPLLPAGRRYVMVDGPELGLSEPLPRAFGPVGPVRSAQCDPRREPRSHVCTGEDAGHALGDALAGRLSELLDLGVQGPALAPLGVDRRAHRGLVLHHDDGARAREPGSAGLRRSTPAVRR